MARIRAAEITRSAPHEIRGLVDVRTLRYGGRNMQSLPMTGIRDRRARAAPSPILPLLCAIALLAACSKVQLSDEPLRLSPELAQAVDIEIQPLPRMRNRMVIAYKPLGTMRWEALMIDGGLRMVFNGFAKVEKTSDERIRRSLLLSDGTVEVVAFPYRKKTIRIPFGDATMEEWLIDARGTVIEYSFSLDELWPQNSPTPDIPQDVWDDVRLSVTGATKEEEYGQAIIASMFSLPRFPGGPLSLDDPVFPSTKDEFLETLAKETVFAIWRGGSFGPVTDEQKKGLEVELRDPSADEKIAQAIGSTPFFKSVSKWGYQSDVRVRGMHDMDGREYVVASGTIRLDGVTNVGGFRSTSHIEMLIDPVSGHPALVKVRYSIEPTDAVSRVLRNDQSMTALFHLPPSIAQ